METSAVQDPDPIRVHAEELSLRLWELRELLNELVYRQEVQRLLLAAGSVRFLGRVATEVDAVIDQVLELDRRRASSSDKLAVLLGLAAGASLVEVADRLEPGVSDALRSHLSALRSLQAEIAALQQVNVEMSHRGAQAAKDLVDALGGAVIETYSPRGAANRTPVQPSRLDRSL